MRRTCPLALLAVGALAGCGADGPSRQRAAVPTRAGDSAVEIVSDSLFYVVLDDGDTVVFEDTVAGSPSADRDYTFEGTVDPLGSVLVHVLYWEGSGYYLVLLNSGDTVRLDAPPLLSPDGKRFATVSRDLEAGYDPNRLRIYRVAEDNVVLERSLEAEGGQWGPSAAEWMGSDTVRFLRNVHEWGRDVRCTLTPVRLVRRKGRWRIDSLDVPSRTVSGRCP